MQCIQLGGRGGTLTAREKVAQRLRVPEAMAPTSRVTEGWSALMERRIKAAAHLHSVLALSLPHLGSHMAKPRDLVAIAATSYPLPLPALAKAKGFWLPTLPPSLPQTRFSRSLHFLKKDDKVFGKS